MAMKHIKFYYLLSYYFTEINLLKLKLKFNQDPSTKIEITPWQVSSNVNFKFTNKQDRFKTGFKIAVRTGL